MRMRRCVLLLVSILALAALAAPSGALADDCAGADLQPTDANVAQVAQATLCLLNVQRTGAGLAPLSEQAQLDQASMAYSQLMVKESFFAHVAPDGKQLTDRLTDAGYLGLPGSWVVGENIAWGESYLATPREIMKAWMNSAGHKANILSADYREVGLGIATGVPTSTNGGATYTTDFGSRSTDAGTDPGTGSNADVTVGPTTATPTRTSIRTGSKSTVRRATHRRSSRRSCHGVMAGWGAHAAARHSTCSRTTKQHAKRR